MRQDPVDRSPRRSRAGRERPQRSRSRRSGTQLLPQLLSAAVERNPDGDALVSGDRTLTYRELDRRSSRIARALIADGIGPEDIVAVAITRSMDSVLSVWAVAKTGAAFLPVDPTYPPDRVRHMIEDSGAKSGLTTAAFAEELPASCGWHIMDEPAFSAALEFFSDEKIAVLDRTSLLRADHPAYVIYTSGSTGRPKGVVITHTGLASLTADQIDRFELTPSSRTLHFASPSFDASVLELTMAVGAGSTMVVAPTDIYGGAELHGLLLEHAVTHAFVTPAALASVDPDGLDVLEVVVVGGESCPPELAERWSPGRRFFNAYGPTESTVASNISNALAPGGPVTIGDAISGTSAYILDRRLRKVPAGVAGELYLAGVGTARGYRNKMSLTSDRFVANPFADNGIRMYRTGDVVRRTAVGGIEFLARNDFQVKVRGFRIELGEIDTAVSAHPSVAFSVTVGHTTASGETVLVSYVRPATTNSVDVSHLIEFVGQSLPKHMIPAAVIVLDEIPLTPAGKLDRDSLPEPVFEARLYREPSTEAEIAVASVFVDVLGVDRAGLDDDFFELGGNSLSATRLAARIGAALDINFVAREVFRDSTVEALARAAERGASGPARIELGGDPRPDRIPLSLAQQRMWFLNRFDTASPAYNIPIAVRLTGELNTGALEAAVHDVIARHEPLRTVYPADETGPMQKVLAADDAGVDVRTTDVPLDRIGDVVRQLAATSFDVTKDVPIRVGLYRLAPNDYVLALVVHHISADGGSMGPLTRDVMTAYAARCAGGSPEWAPLKVQYADFAVWQRRVLGSEEDPTSISHEQISYWKTELAGLPDQIVLPIDRPRPAVQSFAGGKVDFSIDAEIQADLIALARSKNATLFMAVHAAWAALLSRLSGADDIAIGSPIAGRGEAAVDSLIGMFANTLVFRTQVSSSARFDELFASVREADVQALAHADVPFERLVEVLNPARSTARHPLFQVGLSFQNLENATFELPGLTVSGVEADAEVAQFDLHLIVSDQYGPDGEPSGMGATLKYASALFDEPSARRIAEKFATFLAAVADDPSVVVGDVNLLDSAERRTVLHSWNETTHEVDTEATLASMFELSASEHLDAVAVKSTHGLWSYGEFRERVNKLARHLVSIGVGPESAVAVAMRRSDSMLVAMYAIVAAGGAYVPVDPDQPKDRTAYILESADVVAVLVAGQGEFDAVPNALIIDVDAIDVDSYSGAPISDAHRGHPLRSDNTAYIIFTSGSTGRPKGVAVSHRSVVNQLEWMRAEYGLDSSDVSLLKTATTFDLSVWELWSALTSGGSLVIASVDGHRDPSYLVDVIERESVTTLHVVPSVLGAINAAAGGALPGSVRRVLAIGEALPAATAESVLRRADLRLDNVYGPTEAAVSVTANQVVLPVGSTVPIGRPEWNSRVFVLDSRLQPVPVGVVGELYLAGVQLARGYHGRADLTSERFVADPFGDGARIYRTGDLVRWTNNGVLDYVGRSDFQVKVRGFRIELGEIEAVLGGLEGVRDAVVLATHDSKTGDRVVAYIVGDADGSIGIDMLKSAAAKRLPSYMIPSIFVVLESLPLTVNGKLDRKALPEPELEHKVFRAPSTESEVQVAAVFADMLGVEGVGVDDDFFELGGNSLLATRVIAELSDHSGYSVPLLWLFSDSIVGELAARIEAGPISTSSEDAALDVVLPLRDAGAARRLWVIHPIVGVSWAFAGLSTHLGGGRDITALQSPALSEENWEPASIEEWASRYAKEIRDVQPNGPYELLGWSLGGVLAHAVAVQLQEAGCIVSLLAMMDSHVGGRGELSEVGADATPMTLFDLFGGLISTDVIDGTAGADSVDGVELSTEAIARVLSSLPSPLCDVAAERVERVVRSSSTAADLIDQYAPRSFTGDLIYFTAGSDDPSGSIGVTGWTSAVTGVTKNVVVDATHWTMASPSALAVIGAVLNEH